MKSKETDKSMGKLLLYIQGGLGKVIMSTAVIRNYKEKYPDTEIITVSGYPEVFLNNPYVHRALLFNQPYLWKDYVSKKDTRVFAEDPYYSQEWIKDMPDKHLIDIWANMLDPKVKVKHKYPELYFSAAEVTELNNMIATDLPLLVVQSTGGADPTATDWTRNPPKAELEKYLESYLDNYFVLHLAVPGTPVLENVNQRIEVLSRRQAMCLVYYAPKFIGIDSFGLHVRAALGERSDTDIFLPIRANVNRLSYDTVNNIIPCETVQKIIEEAPLYHSTIFRHAIQSPGESCPVPVGQDWFTL